MAMPTIRSDYRAIESYVAAAGRKVPMGCRLLWGCPLTGDTDKLTTVAEAQAWRQHTDADFRIAVCPGGHFFVIGNLAAVQDENDRELAAVRQFAADARYEILQVTGQKKRPLDQHPAAASSPGRKGLRAHQAAAGGSPQRAQGVEPPLHRLFLGRLAGRRRSRCVVAL
jgi:hypothetical protein